MSSSVLAELEQLRQILEQPGSSGLPLPAFPSAAHQTPIQPYRPPQTSLSIAERGVDRLGKAIEAAEEEMENALKRTETVHKSQLRQREMELAELQRLLQAKERSIDSLRDTLATTKRTFEARLAQAESSLSLKEAEVVALSEEVRVAHMERDSLATQLQKQTVVTGRELDELRGQEAALAADVRNKLDEVARLTAALRAERQETHKHQNDSLELRRQMELLGDELRIVKIEARADKERLESQVELLKQRLRTERGVRKACEKWLRSELKSREEMDLLLSAIRDAAQGGGPPALSTSAAVLKELLPDHEDDAHLLLDALQVHDAQQADVGTARKVAAAAGALRAAPTHQAVVNLTAQSQKIVEENRRLQSELQSVRRLLTDRLLK